MSTLQNLRGGFCPPFHKLQGVLCPPCKKYEGCFVHLCQNEQGVFCPGGVLSYIRKGHFKTQSDKLGKGVGDSPPSGLFVGIEG